MLNFNIVVLYNHIKDNRMLHIENSLISDVRSASRDLVRQFGLMNQNVAGTDLSLSAVHAIIEIGQAGKLSSRDLGSRLQLEKSTVSRLVKSLVARAEVRELRSSKDLRIKLLSLTRHGKKTLDNIDLYAEAQVSNALARLSNDSQWCVLRGLQNYSSALNASTQSNAIKSVQSCQIKTGYVPTIIARTVEMLHLHMQRHFDFGAGFESRIATDLAEFMSRIDAPCNQIWHAHLNHRILGSISIDGQDLGDGLAHLRWFVVSDSMRGGGVGKALLQQALGFCDEQGFKETRLWTVKGLDSARKLYQDHGFELAEEYQGNQWGTPILEQQFVRPGRH